jgi:uncharacterized protein YprB with RNaseH-like and TPR domain
MLRHTFIHIPGVGPSTERSLWRKGIGSWDDCHIPHLPSVCGAGLAGTLRSFARQSEASLRNGDAAYFDRLLPKSESWRMYADFRFSTAYVDVETDGPRGQGQITVIGLFDGRRTKHFVKGRNLPDFAREIRKFSLLVTYNGKQFDAPFLCDTFGDIFSHMGHLDLQYSLRRLGYQGGLKAIQEQFGLHREGALSYLDGRYAVWLWEEHVKGNPSALNTLVRYNLEDAVVLQSLAEAVYGECSRKLPIRVPALRPGRPPVLDIPFDEELVKKLRKKRSLFSEAYLPPALRNDGRYVPSGTRQTPQLAPG